MLFKLAGFTQNRDAALPFKILVKKVFEKRENNKERNEKFEICGHSDTFVPVFRQDVHAVLMQLKIANPVIKLCNKDLQFQTILNLSPH